MLPNLATRSMDLTPHPDYATGVVGQDSAELDFTDASDAPKKQA